MAMVDGLVDYVRGGGDVLPIILAEYKGSFYLVEGKLRLEACRKAGVKKMLAIIIPVKSLEELQDLIYRHRNK